MRQLEVTPTIVVVDKGHDRRQQPVGHLDLVLCEVLLPGGLDGIPQLCEGPGAAAVHARL